MDGIRVLQNKLSPAPRLSLGIFDLPIQTHEFLRLQNQISSQFLRTCSGYVRTFGQNQINSQFLRDTDQDVIVFPSIAKINGRFYEIISEYLAIYKFIHSHRLAIDRTKCENSLVEISIFGNVSTPPKSMLDRGVHRISLNGKYVSTQSHFISLLSTRSRRLPAWPRRTSVL
jgi:hypothetical protein